MAMVITLTIDVDTVQKIGDETGRDLVPMLAKQVEAAK